MEESMKLLNDKGITLIELLTVLSIAILFIGILGSVGWQVQSFFSKENSNLQIKSDTNYSKVNLQNWLSDITEVYYSTPYDIRFRNIKDECLSLKVNSNDIEFYMGSCQDLVNVTALTNTETITLNDLSSLKIYTLKNNSSTELTTVGSSVDKSFKLSLIDSSNNTITSISFSKIKKQ
jgi:Tfp pilus assembly protein PilV